MKTISLVIAVGAAATATIGGIAAAVAQDRGEVSMQRKSEIMRHLSGHGRAGAPFAARTDFEVLAWRRVGVHRRCGDAGALRGREGGALFFRFFQDAERSTGFVLLSESQSSGGFAARLTSAHSTEFDRAVVAQLLTGASRLSLAAESGPDDGYADPALVAAQKPTAPTAAKTLERLRKVGMGTVPFVLFVDVPVKHGGAATLKGIVERVRIETLKEPNAIEYGYFQDLDRPHSFLLFEWWDSFAAMNAHLKLPHFTDLMRAFARRR